MRRPRAIAASRPHTTGIAIECSTARARNAAGGARDYFKDGVLTEGFALVAWPAEYGVSGIMTFVVNQDGDVFQRDLGTDTEARVAAMSAFDPDRGWKKVE